MLNVKHLHPRNLMILYHSHCLQISNISNTISSLNLTQPLRLLRIFRIPGGLKILKQPLFPIPLRIGCTTHNRDFTVERVHSQRIGQVQNIDLLVYAHPPISYPSTCHQNQLTSKVQQSEPNKQDHYPIHLISLIYSSPHSIAHEISPHTDSLSTPPSPNKLISN